jgi:DNA modification methylase
MAWGSESINGLERDARDDDGRGHGTQKPVECMRRPLQNHEGNVYDPFLGSGTTICAAEQVGRICFGLELEPKYVAVILERLSEMGLKPELVK